MNTCLLCAVVVGAAVFSTATGQPHSPGAGGGFTRCVNMWDEGCINDQLQGAGRDDDFVNGDFSPGRRCVGAWGSGCGAPRPQRRPQRRNGEHPAAAAEGAEAEEGAEARRRYFLLAKLLDSVQ